MRAECFHNTTKNTYLHVCNHLCSYSLCRTSRLGLEYINIEYESTKDTRYIKYCTRVRYIYKVYTRCGTA